MAAGDMGAWTTVHILPPQAVQLAPEFADLCGLINWPVLRSVWQLGTKLVPGADLTKTQITLPRHEGFRNLRAANARECDFSCLHACAGARHSSGSES